MRLIDRKLNLYLSSLLENPFGHILSVRFEELDMN